MNGVLLINKERNWTSRDVCNKLQKIFKTKSIGHTGTLDPFAEGLLVVTINNANKIMQFTDEMRKTYIAELTLGKKTSTGDLMGNAILEKEVREYALSEIEETLKSFVGKIKQIPPMTSAVHFEGRKLYELHYEGIEVEREAREVEVFSLKLISYKDNKITFEAEVSKGTYIRVLGEDIAEKLNTVGYLTSLIRTKVGNLSLENAKKLGEVTGNEELIPIGDVLTHIEKYYIEDDMIKKIKNGMTLQFEDANDDLILIMSKSNEALAIYKKISKKKMYHCLRGLW